jgi:hypothetical protein
MSAAQKPVHGEFLLRPQLVFEISLGSASAIDNL